jgi:hypothetical protein
LFLTQNVKNTTRQSLHLLEIISILDCQLCVDECVPAEQRLWKKREVNWERPVFNSYSIDVFLNSKISCLMGLPPGREPRQTTFVF